MPGAALPTVNTVGADTTLVNLRVAPVNVSLNEFLRVGVIVELLKIKRNVQAENALNGVVVLVEEVGQPGYDTWVVTIAVHNADMAGILAKDTPILLSQGTGHGLPTDFKHTVAVFIANGEHRSILPGSVVALNDLVPALLKVGRITRRKRG